MHQESHHRHHHCHCQQGPINPEKRLFITECRLNHHVAGDELRSHFSPTRAPVFSWALQTAGKATRQAACQITVRQEDRILWDSGMVQTDAQEIAYAGQPLPQGPQLTLTLTVVDDTGATSEPFASFFYVTDTDWQAPWIAAPADAPCTFRKLFSITRTLDSARLYVTSMGLQRILLNGEPLDEGPVDEAPLDPPAPRRNRPPQFVFYPEIQDQLEEDNCLAVTVAPRRLKGGMPPMLTAMLVLQYADGTTEQVLTDSTWTCAPSPISASDLMAGTTDDERLRIPSHDLHPTTIMAEDEEDLEANRLKAPQARQLTPEQAPQARPVPMTLPPVTGADDLQPVTQWPFGNTCILDFGQVISGVMRLRIPQDLPQGTAVTICYATDLAPDGSLPHPETCPQDTYIASGEEDDERFFHPPFTCHAFRYAQVRGLGSFIPTVDVAAVSLRMDLDADSSFTCANPLFNELHRRCLENQHRCCQGLDASHFQTSQPTLRPLPYPSAMETAVLVRQLLQDALRCRPEDISPAGAAQLLIAIRQAFLAYGDQELLVRALPLCRTWMDSLKLTERLSISHMCLAYLACKLVQDIATDTRQARLEQDCQSTTLLLRRSFLQHCYDATAHALREGTPADLAQALCFGLIPEEERTAAARTLGLSATLDMRPESACGILDALTEGGFADQACQMLNSYLTAPGADIACPALNHWLFARLAGITITAPAAATLRICPVFPQSLASLSATMQTVRGPVTVRWFRKDGQLNLHVTVPAGTVATVCFNGSCLDCKTGFHTFARKLPTQHS